jgi:hypothetical protein
MRSRTARERQIEMPAALSLQIRGVAEKTCLSHNLKQISAAMLFKQRDEWLSLQNSANNSGLWGRKKPGVEE